ncbi:MAG: mechanosensitive ion channel family protein [Candidatus Moranbacteria bacterium]|nr:mechanosensitive ion channel family protein [Candidatus Moranbacteria bacterium]
MSYQEFLESSFLGNTGQEYLYALGVLVVALIFFKVFQFVIIKKLEKATKMTQTDVDDFLISLVKSVRPPFYFIISVYISLTSINTTPVMRKIINIMVLLVVVYEAVMILQKVIDYMVEKITKSEDGEEDKDKEIVKLLGNILKVVLWVIAALLVLANLGVNVTSAIAGLGIGGIAIAMAVKDVLSDMIASFAIFLDKPFKVGQSIKIGKDAGEVKRIGIRSTRIKTPQGEEMVVTNQDLTKARIQNFKRMEKRRVKQMIGVVYGLKSETLKDIPVWIKEIVDATENAEFSRAHFTTYGDFSLNFEIVYHIATDDYLMYMNAQQEINLAIYEKFEKEAVEFAYPTQTVIVEKA